MYKSFRMSIFAITLILIIVVLSSFVFPITNFAYALSNKDFLCSSSSLPLQSSNEFLYKMVDGQRNKCHNEYKLNAVECIKDDVASNGNPSTSPLRSSLFHPSNESQIVPADTGSSRARSSAIDRNNHNTDNQNSSIR